MYDFFLARCLPFADTLTSFDRMENYLRCLEVVRSAREIERQVRAVFCDEADGGHEQASAVDHERPTHGSHDALLAAPDRQPGLPFRS
jgi:hypothetical protein